MSFAEKFGGDADTLGAFEPVMAPLWLGEALRFESESADMLKGRHLIFCFGDEEGGWARGEIVDVLTDPEDTEEVTEGDVTGHMPRNFLVKYEDGEIIPHLLTVDDYATSAQEKSGWCLVVGKAAKAARDRKHGVGGGGGKGKAAAKDVSPGTAVARMSAEERAAMRAALDAAGA